MDPTSEEKKDDGNNEEEEEVEKIDPKTLKPDLYAAAMANNLEKVVNLIQQGVPATFIDTKTNWTPLHWAAMNGNARMTKVLIESGASEPYHRLRARGRNDIRQEEKDTGSKNQQPEEDNDGSLSEAKQEGTDQNSLQEEDDDFDDPERELEVSIDLLKNTPLLWATMNGYLRVIWLLLADGYSPNDIDSMDNTALHLAAAYGDVKIVNVLIDDGASANKVNIYKNLAIDMAKNKECRDVLSVAMVVGASMTEYDMKVKHDNNIRKYNKMISDITSAVSEASKVNNAKSLKTLSISNSSKLSSALSESIAVSKEWSLDEDLITLGEKLYNMLEVMQELIADILELQRCSPIRSQSVYIDKVYKLEKSMDRAESVGIERNQLQSAQDLISRCQIEYWLSTMLSRLKDVTVADDSNEHDMTKLRNAIKKAEALQASESLTNEGTIFLKRLDAELGMSRAIATIPSVRLPMENPPEGYYKESDIGKIEETEGYPLPPIDNNNEYIWIPALTFTLLGQSIELLKESYNGADLLGANPTVIAESKEKLTKAEKEYKVLEAKDAADKTAAIEVAKKLAKKLKKGKKK